MEKSKYIMSFIIYGEIMEEYNGTIREQYRDNFRDYLGQRLSKERPLSGIRYIERVIYGYVSDE